MRKLSIILISMAIFAAACGDGGDAFGPDADISAGTMDEIGIVTNVQSGLDGSWTQKMIMVDSSRQLVVSIVRSEEFIISYDEEAIIDECSGVAEISEDDYLSLETAVTAADPMNYEEPEMGESCTPPLGMLSYGFVYKDISGEEAMASTNNCEDEEAMNNLYLVMNGLADRYVTDCTDESLSGDDSQQGGGNDSDSGDAFAGEMPTYEYGPVPILNPRKLPVPRRVKY